MKVVSALLVFVFIGYSFSVAVQINGEFVNYDTFSTRNNVNTGPMDSCWPMKSHDVFHTGQSEYSTELNNGAELWKFKTFNDGRIDGSIAIDKDGVLYFGDSDWYFYAVYPNGTLKWKYKLSGVIWSTPALAEDGTIYIGSFGNDFYAFNPDGTLKWSYDALHSISTSPAIASDGMIYFGTMGSSVDGCRVYAFNPNGTMKWFYQTGDAISSDPAIGSDGAIYIGSMDKHLYALNPNGTLKWRYKTGDEIHSHPSVGPDGTIYFGSNDNYLYAVYPNGTLQWKYKVNGQVYSTVAIAEDGTIYGPDHDLYAFYPNGTLKWRFDFGEELVVSSSPAIAKEGTIYIGVTKKGVSGGYIFAINPDGTERWSRKIGNYWAESSPAIGTDGTVYIGSASHDPPDYMGYLYAFGEGNRKPEKPTINGPSEGRIGKKYTFTIKSSDPEEDNISYFVDWDDGSDSGWQGPYSSGTEITISHTWISERLLSIRAKAKDEHGKESDWSTLSVSMPKEKTLQSPFLEMLLERFLQFLQHFG